MVWEKSVFVYCTEDITLWEDISLFNFEWYEGPHFGGIKGWNIDSSWDVDRIGVFSDDFEWSLNTVKDLIEDTGTEFDGEGLFGSFDWISYSKAG